MTVLELTDNELTLLKTIVSIFPEMTDEEGYQLTDKGVETYSSIVAKLSDPNELLGEEDGN